MEQASPDFIATFRSASRKLVRELGFMNRTLAGTDLSASAVHAIIEIGAANSLSSKDLSEKLLLEKSTVSRLVKSLIDRGNLDEFRSREDARVKHLRLSPRGEQTLAAINAFAEQQVAQAIAPLDQRSRRTILAGLQKYSAALKAGRQASEPAPPVAHTAIKQGYTSGLIGRIVDMHAAYYSRHAGLGAAFEAKVAGELADFTGRLNNPENAIWYVQRGENIAGSIAIDGEDLRDQRAHLRWFIVDDEIRGTGTGRSLIHKALEFCDDSGFRETHLWTFKGLDAARSVYEKSGFSLAEETRGVQWGVELLEQKFVRPRGGSTPASAA